MMVGEWGGFGGWSESCSIL